MCIKTVIVTFLCVFAVCAYCESQDYKGLQIVQRTFNECILNTNESYTCLSEKVARALERSMDWDVQILDGMTLIRNHETISHRQARLLGIDRLNQAIQNFFRTHVVSLELGGARKLGKGAGMDYGSGGLDYKGLKKEKKYMKYAFMVLLGIFGLTGPLVMKVIGLMAAKALLAAKAALIIVGSVALKKLFEKDEHYEPPSIKVHTIDHDEHEEYDRFSKYGFTGHGYANHNTGPYYKSPYSYYDEYYGNEAGKN